MGFNGIHQRAKEYKKDNEDRFSQNIAWAWFSSIADPMKQAYAGPQAVSAQNRT